MILTGDTGQLPPVADKPLYHAKPSSAVGEQGYQTYRMFDKVVKLRGNSYLSQLLAWALTIHKSEGLTLPAAWIDIGKLERTSGGLTLQSVK